MWLERTTFNTLTFWPLHTRGMWAARLTKIQLPSLWTSQAGCVNRPQKKTTLFNNQQDGCVKRACNVIARQLHLEYKSRGRVKLHALNSASIKPKPNSPAPKGAAWEGGNVVELCSSEAHGDEGWLIYWDIQISKIYNHTHTHTRTHAHTHTHTHTHCLVEVSADSSSV